MKKILIVSPNAFLPQYDLFTDHVIGKKMNQDDTIKVSFVTGFTKGYPILSKYSGVLTYRIPFLFFTSKLITLPISFFIAIILLAITRPNIVFVHHFRSNTHFLILLSKIIGIKTILAEWGILHDEYLTKNRNSPLEQKIEPENIIYDIITFKKSKDPFLDKLYNYLRHWKWYNVDKIIFYSKHNIYYAKLLNILKPKIIHCNCYIDFSYIDFNDYNNDYNDVNNKFEFIKNKKVVFMIGQLKLRKGYDIFLQVAKKITNARDDVIFILASSTRDLNLDPIFCSEIKELGLSDQIKFFFKLSNRDRNFLYKNCAVYFMPSRYEGFGLPAIEAGYSGALVVASDVPALNEFLVNNLNCLLFENQNIGDAINKLNIALNLEDGHRQKLTNNLIVTCKEFSIENANLKDIYD